MTTAEYALAIRGLAMILNEATSSLIMMKRSIQNAKDLANADKETLIKEIELAQAGADAQKYPENET